LDKLKKLFNLFFECFVCDTSNIVCDTSNIVCVHCGICGMPVRNSCECSNFYC
jgi:transcription elongation factor Elf1